MIILFLQKGLELKITKWMFHCLLAHNVLHFWWINHFYLPGRDDLLCLRERLDDHVFLLPNQGGHIDFHRFILTFLLVLLKGLVN